MSNFTFFQNVFYANCILKSFNSHISVVACSFFEFGTVSKWSITEWVNPFPNKPLFLHVCIISVLKTLWKKEKLLVMSNFSFYYSVFSTFGELSAVLSDSKLSSANSSSLDKSKILSFWKGLQVSNSGCFGYEAAHSTL